MTLVEGMPGTWSHCGNQQDHNPHRHTVVQNEGPYDNVLCKGTPGDSDGTAPLGSTDYPDAVASSGLNMTGKVVPGNIPPGDYDVTRTRDGDLEVAWLSVPHEADNLSLEQYRRLVIRHATCPVCSAPEESPCHPVVDTTARGMYVDYVHDDRAAVYTLQLWLRIDAALTGKIDEVEAAGGNALHLKEAWGLVGGEFVR